MRLKYQLFLSLLLCSVVLIALLAAFTSWTFNRGFSNFVVEGERRRIESVVEQLGTLYQENKGWDWIQTQPHQLQQLQRQHRQDSRRLDPFARNNDRADRNRPRAAAESRRGPPPLILIDAARNLVVGNHIPTSNMVWEPVLVDSNTVGYVGIREPRGIPDGLANMFVRQQLRSNIIAAGVMAVLSALLAIALASRLVKPILNINTAVGEISGGNYRHKILKSSRDELGNLSNNINQLALTLDKNQHARQQWTAEISHELRTPVAILQGELEAMQDGIKSIDRNAIDSLHAETQRLSTLINDLHDLSLSDIGALDYTMAPVDLHALVHQRIQAANSQFEQTALSVSLTPAKQPLLVHGDEKRIGQLIDNLIQNSVRYTHSGGQLKVSLAQVPNTVGADDVVLQWCDSSPGVSDEQLSQLFEPLYRTDESRSRESGGAGLGLAIVKKIADAHAATLNAHHSDEGGLGIRLVFSKDYS